MSDTAFACGPEHLTGTLDQVIETLAAWRKEIAQRHSALKREDQVCFRAELRSVATTLHGLAEAETEQ